MAGRKKRSFERTKRRLLVEFNLGGANYSGFTNDISPTGLFVRSNRLPDPGTALAVSLHLPEGKHVVLRGKVVRSFRVPAALSRLIPSGFALQLSDSPEDYFQFLASL
ncbi:MAG: PilZ domain-containing protein [Acidobacteriota bacterium]